MRRTGRKTSVLVLLILSAGTMYATSANASGKGRMPDLIKKTLRRTDDVALKQATRTDVSKSSQQHFQSFSERFNTVNITSPQRGLGSVSKPPVQRRDGTVHLTSYNEQARVHYSHDVRPDGTIVNRHWKDHTTGKKVGGRD